MYVYKKIRRVPYNFLRCFKKPQKLLIRHLTLAQGFINQYAATMDVVTVEWELVPKAIAIHKRYQKSYYDSLHLAAAACHAPSAGRRRR